MEGALERPSAPQSHSTLAKAKGVCGSVLRPCWSTVGATVGGACTARTRCAVQSCNEGQKYVTEHVAAKTAEIRRKGWETGDNSVPEGQRTALPGPRTSRNSKSTQPPLPTHLRHQRLQTRGTNESSK